MLRFSHFAWNATRLNWPSVAFIGLLMVFEPLEPFLTHFSHESCLRVSFWFHLTSPVFLVELHYASIIIYRWILVISKQVSKVMKLCNMAKNCSMQFIQIYNCNSIHLIARKMLHRTRVRRFVTYLSPCNAPIFWVECLNLWANLQKNELNQIGSCISPKEEIDWAVKTFWKTQ